MFNNKQKKVAAIIAIVLVLAMVLSMCLAAFIK